MKTSNKLLIGIGSALVALVIAAVLVARFVLGNVVTVPLTGKSTPFVPSGMVVTRTYEESGFSGVSAGGAWDITLKQGHSYSVVVTVPKSVADRVDVRTSGKLLHLGVKPGTTLTNNRMSAEITMPSLSSVHLSGANRASLSGFSGDRLDIQCSGAASVTGTGGSYRSLKVAASGASSVMFRDLPTDNAQVDLNGAGRAELQMTGGALTGHLSGAGRVTYWGTVSTQSIETSGIGSVTHR